MDTLHERKERTISMSSNTASTTDSVGDSQTMTKTVRFHPVVRVAMLPIQEREDARRARHGLWKPAPMSDELWDGEFMVFRPVELSPEDFKTLTNPNKRRKSPMPRSFANMFSLATSGSVQEGTLAGVDIIHARARVYAEDFDELERDSFGRLEESEEEDKAEDATDEHVHLVVKLSAEELDNGDVVLKFQHDLSTLPPPPPPSKKASQEKVTKFVPSPPSEPSPSERAGLIIADRQQPNKKKSSVLSTGSQSSFVCGEGKRSTVLLAEEPIKDENEVDWDSDVNAALPKIMKKKKRSVIGFMFETLGLMA